jgi:hypothetical protein
MFPEGTRREKGLRKKHTARWQFRRRADRSGRGPARSPAGIAGTDGLTHPRHCASHTASRSSWPDLGSMPIEDAAHDATDRLSFAIAKLEGSLS